MSNVSYPKFGKVKTIVLPIPTDDVSVAEYKDQFGIDLSEFMTTDGENIYIDAKEALILISDPFGHILDVGSSDYYWSHNGIFPISSVYAAGWAEGVSAAQLRVGFWSSVAGTPIGLYFYISKDNPCEIAYMRIQASAV